MFFPRFQLFSGPQITRAACVKLQHRRSDYVYEKIAFLSRIRADSSVSENDVPPDSNGLSEFGKLVVKEMNRLGNCKN